MTPTGMVAATFVINYLAGYVRYRVGKWAPDQFKAILVEPDGIHKRVSRRKFAKAMDAMKYRVAVADRLARWRTAR